MGSVRSLVLSGVLAAAVAVPASAADLGYAPPIYSAPPPAPVSELGTGWYIRGDLGYAEPSKNRNGGEYAYDRHGDISIGSIGGGFGYQFLNWLRADVTFDYRDRISGRSSGRYAGLNVSYDGGDLKSSSLLFNAYADLGNWGGFTPYVGAGIGGAETCTSVSCGGVYSQYGDYYGTNKTKSYKYSLAWALMAGVAVDIGMGFKLDAGYRYLRMGDERTGIDQYGYAMRLNPLDAHEFRAGLRYMID